MTNIEIGARISLQRKKLGLTLGDVAKKIGVANSTIQRYEAGQIHRLKMPVINAIADALCVNPLWLLGESDDPSVSASAGAFDSPINFTPDMIERGGVYFVSRSPKGESTTRKNRPAVIVSDVFTDHHGTSTVLVVYLTSNPDLQPSDCHIPIHSSTLPHAYALCDKVTTLDIQKIRRFGYRLPEKELESILAGIAHVLQIPFVPGAKVLHLDPSQPVILVTPASKDNPIL